MRKNMIGKRIASRTAIIILVSTMLLGCSAVVDVEVPRAKTASYLQCLAPSLQGRCFLGQQQTKTSAIAIRPLTAKELPLDNPFRVDTTDASPAASKVSKAGTPDGPQVGIAEVACVLGQTGVVDMPCWSKAFAPRGSAATPVLSRAVSPKTMVSQSRTDEARKLLSLLHSVYGDGPSFYLVGAEIVEAHMRVHNSAGGSARSSSAGAGSMELLAATTDKGFGVLTNNVTAGIDSIVDKLEDANGKPVEAEISGAAVLDYLGDIRELSTRPDGWRTVRSAVRIQQHHALTRMAEKNVDLNTLKRTAEGFDVQARRIGFLEAYVRSYFREGDVVKFQLAGNDVKEVEDFIKHIDDLIEKEALGLKLGKLEEMYLARLRNFLGKKYSNQKGAIAEFIEDWMKPDKVWIEFVEEFSNKKRRLLDRLANHQAVQKLTRADREALFAELERLADRLLPTIKPWYDKHVAEPLRIHCIDNDNVGTVAEAIAACLPKLSLAAQIPPDVQVKLYQIYATWEKLRPRVEGVLISLRDGITIKRSGGEDVALKTRSGDTLQSPRADVRVGLIKQQFAEIANKDEIKRVPPDLVRVVVEALFDSYQRLPAVSDATGASPRLANPLPAFADIEGTSGYEHVSIADFRDISSNAAIVEGAAGLGTSVAVRGFNVFSIDNEVVEAMVETLIASIVRKAAEKLLWCAYACDIFDAGTGSTSSEARVRALATAVTDSQKIRLKVNYGGMGF